RLRCVQAVEEAQSEGLSGRALERVREGVHRRLRDEDVALRRVALTGPSARPVVTLAASEGLRAPLAVDDTELPLRAAAVGGSQPLDDLAGREPLPEQDEPVRAVARAGVGLRRDRTDVRLCPRNDRSDSEELRLDGAAP